MSAVVTKDFLKLEEFAKSLGRGYSTVRNWAIARRFKTERKVVKGRTYFRVPAKEAVRVKAEIERGAWF